MNCAEFRDLLNPFLDSELEVEQNVACLKHVELCTARAAQAEHERALLTKLVGKECKIGKASCRERV